MIKTRALLSSFAALTAVAGICGAVAVASQGHSDPPLAVVANAAGTETLVLFRHGEKTAQEYGQLSPKGLNRSLALSGVLIGKYGKPDFLFAPNPSAQIHSRTDSQEYSYIRPLATIEPTAIRLGMPVNTQYGFTDIAHLQSELAQPKYASAVVFVAWEHGYLDKFAKDVVKANGGDAESVPKWSGNDFDSIFVIRLQHAGANTTATFTLDHEGLDDKIGDDYPAPAAGK